MSLANILQSPLLKAVKENNIDRINELLIENVDENEKIFALVEASKQENLEIIKSLIDSGVDVNKEQFFLQGNALNAAVCTGNCLVVKTLIEAGANVNLLPQNSKEPTPLILATQEGNFDVVKILVEAGVDVNEVRPYGDYALLVAATSGYENIFNYLAPLTNVELHQEALSELPKGIQRRLREEQANPVINELTEAIRRNNIDDIKELLSFGIEVSDFDEYGATPLFWAVQKENIDLVSLLLAAGANPDKGLEIEGTTPLMIIPGMRWTQNTNTILSLLIDAGANVNAKDLEDGENVIIHLIEYPAYSEVEKAVRREAISILLKHGADAKVESHFGNCVLELAKTTQDLELTKLIEYAVNERR